MLSVGIAATRDDYKNIKGQKLFFEFDSSAALFGVGAAVGPGGQGRSLLADGRLRLEKVGHQGVELAVVHIKFLKLL